jgi:hypothetical protein
MVFSSREAGASGVKTRCERLDVLELHEDRIKAFIHEELGAQADAMIGLMDDGLRRLARIPFYLVKLTELYKTSGSLPGNFASVLRRWAEGYESHILTDARTDDRTLLLWREVTEYLAYRMIEADDGTYGRYALAKKSAIRFFTDFLSGRAYGSPGEKAVEILDELLRHYLLQPDSEGVVEFPHPLIQEYFAAEFMLKALSKEEDDRVESQYLNLVKWTEPLKMMLNLSHSQDAILRVVRLAQGVDDRLAAELISAIQPRAQEACLELIADENVRCKAKIALLTWSDCVGICPEGIRKRFAGQRSEHQRSGSSVTG